MFRVISSAEAKELGHWDIEYISTGEIVACITTFHGFRRNIKQLEVKDKIICDVTNQKEVLEKLEEFFSDIKRKIEEEREIHRELLLNQVL